jgi:hypothetical protein
MMLLVVLHYKMHGRRARPDPGPKTEAQHVSWDGHGRDFLNPENLGFFRPGPNPSRPMKCSGLLLSGGGIKMTKGAWQVPKWLAFVASQVVLLGETW